MRVVVPSEHQAGERRVALTPRAAQPLLEAGHTVVVEHGSGEVAGFTDGEYTTAGVQLAPARGLLEGATAVLRVGPPTVEEVAPIAPGAVLIAFLDPLVDHALVSSLATGGITAFAMEAVPRITVAQSMDALSSQASAAGYAAVLLAATELPRFFPMLTTSAGTVPPARVLVLGAGVAGLQAVATAKRLGALVSAYDIRPEAREQIESLGARFVAGPVEDQSSTTGYATEVDAGTQRRQLDELADHVASADVVITTAAVPGRAAPLLVSREMVEAMRPGSVVVDLAAASGGNCELTRPDEPLRHAGVLVTGPTDLPSRVAHDASQTYARNVVALLGRLAPEGEPVLDLDDPVLGGCCITHAGEVVHAGARALLEERKEEA